MTAYRAILGETLLRLPAVSESKTIVVMEQVKSQYKWFAQCNIGLIRK